MMNRASPEGRRAALGSQISTLVVHGRRVESQDDYQAVLVRGRGLLERRELVSVDEYRGSVHFRASRSSESV